MGFRAPVVPWLTTLFVALSVFTFTPRLLAADGMTWQFYESGDPANGGRMTARLVYGVPETDTVQVQGQCAEGGGEDAQSLILGTSTGKLENGADVKLRFSGGGSEFTIDGAVHHPKAEEGAAGVRIGVDTDDPLWDALTEKKALAYQVPGYTASALELEDGRRQIGNFIDACESYANKGKAKKAAQAKTGNTESSSSASDEVPEKEAFAAAKELGTLEAWEAFLENYPDGFRADLARAYVKRIGTAGPDKAAPLPAPPSDRAAAPPAPADIALAMTAQGACTGGRNCSVTLTATNTGGEPFAGQLVIANSVAPGGASLAGPAAQPWSCEEMGGGVLCANYSVTIAAGQSITLPLTFSLPGGAGGQVTSCASISWGGAPTASSVRDVQQALNEAGIDAGPADGQAGSRTVEGIRAFQQRNGLQPTGEIDLPLLLALFTQPGEGDANPLNDQACAGSAVTAAPPLPVAYQLACPLGQIVKRDGACGCPSSVPVWTGTSCIPRVTRNCKGGTYYNKGRKLCMCPGSRPHWYNGRCHARFDDCPGDSVRVGDRCLKQNDPGFQARGRGRGGPHSGGGCPANTTRIGNSCIAASLAPLFNFGNKPQGGQGGRPGNQTFGGGNRPNRPQGGGQTATNNKMSEAQVRAELLSHCNSLGLDGMRQPGTNKLAFNSCAKMSASMAKNAMTAPQKANISQRQAINGFKGEMNAAAAAYKKTQARQINQQPQAVPQGQCPPGQTRFGDKCLRQGAVQQGNQVKCPAGEVPALVGCVKGPVPKCPPGVLHQVTADRRLICATNQGPLPNPNPPKPPANAKPVTTQKQSACVPGTIRYSKGGPCVAGKCPSNATRAANGTCVYGLKPKPKAQSAVPPPIVKQVRPQQGGGQPPQQAKPKVVVQCQGGQVAGTSCRCPAGQIAKLVVARKDPTGNTSRTFQCIAQGVKCGPGMMAQGNKCVSIQKPGAKTSKEIFCAPGTGLVPQNGKCGCPPGRQWNGKVCAAPRQKTQQRPQVQQQQQQNQLSPQQQQQMQQGINNIVKGLKGLSDRRLKRDIEPVATLENGIRLYSFRYLWEDTYRVGVMAQDLLERDATRRAVLRSSTGYYTVDYAALGLRMTTLENWEARGPAAVLLKPGGGAEQAAAAAR